MAERKRSREHPRSHRPAGMDPARTVKLWSRPIAGPVLPFWPFTRFNQPRLVELQVPQALPREEEPES